MKPTLKTGLALALALLLLALYSATLVAAAPDAPRTSAGGPLAKVSPQQEQEFVVQNLTVTPEVVEPGGTVKITVDAVNQGTQAASFSVILNVRRPGRLEFEPLQVKEITPASGQVGTVAFFFAPEEMGRHDVEVDGVRSAFDVAPRIDPASVRLSDLRIEPAQVRPGGTVTVSALVENLGDVDGSAGVKLRLNGVLQQLRAVLVPGLGGVRLAFEVQLVTEGTFMVEMVDPEERVQPLTGQIVVEFPLQPTRLSYGALEISPLEVSPGEVATVSFDLSNLGEQSADRTVILLLDGAEIARRELTLAPLSSTPVSFIIAAPDQPGEHTVSVDGLMGLVRVVELVVPVPRVVTVAQIPGRVQPGESITVAVDLVNDFDVEARRTLALVLDGGTIAQREVVLSPGEAKTEVFTFEAPDVAGIHRVEMDGQVREFEVVAQIVETSLDLVSPLTVSPEQVEPGQLVTITAILRNSGEEEGRTDVILKIGGGEVDRRTVVVPGSSEVPVTFTVTRHEAGDYAVEVEAVVGAHVKVLRGSFRAVSAPSASTESPGPTVAAEPADTAPAATPVPTPLPSPTPSPSPRFSCGAPAGESPRAEAGWIILATVWPGFMLARLRRWPWRKRYPVSGAD